jgi:hypothetical protein
MDTLKQKKTKRKEDTHAKKQNQKSFSKILSCSDTLINAKLALCLLCVHVYMYIYMYNLHLV